MTYYDRGEWGARAPKAGPGRLDGDQVDGIALHWPGMARGVIHGVASVSAALRSWQRLHMDTNGWSDIAYQEAVDQAGNVYALRGLRTQPGANGDSDVNRRFGALLLVVGPDEVPTPELIAAVRHRIDVFGQHFPRGSRIVGHRDIRPEPTACPGDRITALIRKGAFDEAGPNRVERGRSLIRRGLQVLDGIPDGARPDVEKARREIRQALAGMPDK